ncbi:MAG: hypothetical protein WAU28_03240 [Candidatus Moraniibacteriota bacterium]
MPTKINTSATEPEPYPTASDFERLFNRITQAQTLVDSAHEARYTLGKNEQFYREANARYDQAHNTLEVAYHQLVMAQFHLLFRKIGQLEARLTKIADSACGHPI